LKFFRQENFLDGKNLKIKQFFVKIFLLKFFKPKNFPLYFSKSGIFLLNFQNQAVFPLKLTNNSKLNKKYPKSQTYQKTRTKNSTKLTFTVAPFIVEKPQLITACISFHNRQKSNEKEAPKKRFPNQIVRFV
jgi:hypothetical protein